MSAIFRAEARTYTVTESGLRVHTVMLLAARRMLNVNASNRRKGILVQLQTVQVWSEAELFECRILIELTLQDPKCIHECAHTLQH